MERTTFTVGTFEVNCSILGAGGKALVVDPGADAAHIAAQLARLRLDPLAILLTHAHFDHVSAVPELQRRFPGLSAFISAADAQIVSHPFNQFPPDYPPVGQLANVRDTAELAAFLREQGWPEELRVVETPGHTPGGVCFLFPGLLFSGDTLFCGSVGRTDFPGGDMSVLSASLEKLKSLPGETVVVPGHGCETTIKRELAGNPFLQ